MNPSHITDYSSPFTYYSSLITDYPKVSIIILNWNGLEDIIECLDIRDAHLALPC